MSNDMESVYGRVFVVPYIPTYTRNFYKFLNVWCICLQRAETMYLIKVWSENFSNKTFFALYSNKTLFKLFSNKTVFELFPNKTLIERFSSKTLFKLFSNKTVFELFSNKTLLALFSNETLIEPFRTKLHSNSFRTKVLFELRAERRPQANSLLSCIEMSHFATKRWWMTVNLDIWQKRKNKHRWRKWQKHIFTKYVSFQ
jgi:hypothetical protein